MPWVKPHADWYDMIFWAAVIILVMASFNMAGWYFQDTSWTSAREAQLANLYVNDPSNTDGASRGVSPFS